MTRESEGESAWLETKREKKKFGGKEVDVVFTKAVSPDEFPKLFPPVFQKVEVNIGIVIERDVPVKLRDGATIYTDIYRPEGAVNVPAIVAWSPYGKTAGWGGIDPMLGTPLSSLIIEDSVSSYAKFEGPDPAYWCHYGYAVINPDPRGVGNSEGDIRWFGTPEAEDCYDLIEYIAACDWCNGKVAMQGNSWLAVMQWFAASLRPPHLACISPWSGLTDIYRALVSRGGCVDTKFNNWILYALRGHQSVENPITNIRAQPLLNEYWQDKVAKVEKIEIPVYAVANYNNFHNSTMDAFRRMPSKNKWLRIENTVEWPDNYENQNLEDLRRFYDRYLKDIRNGWESTPRVRISVYNPGGVDQVARPEKEWPLARAQFQPLYLDASNGALSQTPVSKETSVSYSATKKGEAAFTLRFDKDTEIVGYWKLRLWVEVKGANDMGIIVSIRKLDPYGKPLMLPIYGLPHGGISGCIRVSHRAIDEEKSTPSEPWLTHNLSQPVKPGEIVPLEIPLWPLGMSWRKGEQLSVVVSSHVQLFDDYVWSNMFGPELPAEGELVIHSGGRFDSYLLVPVIPDSTAH
jgi:predicted acyl esterase